MKLNEGMIKDKTEMPDLKEKESSFGNMGIIDFHNVTSPINQAKVEIMVLDRSLAGISLLQYDTRKKIANLRRQKSNSNDSKIVELKKQMSVYQDEWQNKLFRKSDIIKKYWFKQWDQQQYLLSREFHENKEFRDKKCEELDKFLSNENVDEGFQADKRPANECELHQKRPRSLVEPKEYSPSNDPDNEFGWKALCNRQNKLEYQWSKEGENFSCKKNKSLGVSMKIIDDKKSACPEDSGVELNTCSSSDDSDYNKDLHLLDISKDYDTIINREWLEFLFSKKDFMSQELKESFQDDMGLKYLMERPTPNFVLEEHH